MFDKEKVRECLEKRTCYKCGKHLTKYENKFYRVSFGYRGSNNNNCNMIQNGNHFCSAANIRFCVDCWKKIAGEDFCFDENEFKMVGDWDKK